LISSQKMAFTTRHYISNLSKIGTTMPCSYESVRRHSRVVFSNPGPDINFTTQLVNPCLVLSQPTSLLNVMLPLWSSQWRKGLMTYLEAKSLGNWVCGGSSHVKLGEYLHKRRKHPGFQPLDREATRMDEPKIRHHRWKKLMTPTTRRAGPASIRILTLRTRVSSFIESRTKKSPTVENRANTPLSTHTRNQDQNMRISRWRNTTWYRHINHTWTRGQPDAPFSQPKD